MSNTLKQNPVRYAGFDQALVLDETVKESRIYQIDHSRKGDTSLYTTATIEQEIIGYTRMNTVVLEVPLDLTFTTNSARDTPLSFPHSQAYHAEWGLMQWCYQMRILINDVPLEKEEAYRLPSMRTTISDYKYDEDDYEILANLGLPYSVTKINAEPALSGANIDVILSLPYQSNPAPLRDRYENLMKASYSRPLRLDGDQFTTTYTDDRGGIANNAIWFTFTQKFRQTIPLHFICRAFRSKALLPPGTRIKVEIFAHRLPQVFCVAPGPYPGTNGVAVRSSWFTVAADMKQNSPFVKYLSLDLSNDMKKQLVDYRKKSDTISYANDLLEEHHVADERSRLFNFQLQIQQQFPTQLLFKYTALRTFCPIATAANTPADRYFFAPTDAVPYWKIAASDQMYFADSSCHLGGFAPTGNTVEFADLFVNDNTIEYLQILKSGKLLVDYKSRESTYINGSMNINSDAYIFALQSKESFTSLNRMGHLRGFEMPIGSRWRNGALSIILHPGGVTDLGLQPGDTNAFNINVRMQLSKVFPFADLLDFKIYIKKPSTFEIDAFDNTYVHMWPEIEKNRIWSVIVPRLAN